MTSNQVYAYKGGTMSRIRLSAILIILTGVLFADSLDQQRALIHARRERQKQTVSTSLERIADSFSSEMERIREKAADEGLTGLVSEIQAECRKLRDSLQNFDLESSQKEHKESSAETSEEKALRKKIEKARQNMTRQKISLADSCFKAGLIGTAYDLAFSSFSSYTDQKDLRKLFGYYSAGDSWMRKYEYMQYKKGFIWDTRYGWIYRSVADKYNGSNWFDGRNFVPLQQAQQEHSNWKNPWVIETEHFIVKSNMELAKAVGLASRLESFYRQFFRYYVGFFSFDKSSAMDSLFKMEKAKKLTVHYWKDKMDFLAHAQSLGAGGMGGSAGFYSPRHGTSQFYHIKGYTESVLYHEVTHQILGEYGKGGFPDRGAYWIVEGAAVASESTKVTGEFSVVFDPMKNSRIKSVKKSWGNRSIGQFMNISYDQFHGSGRLMNYAVAGTLAVFFLEYKGGVYRDDFTDYLRDVYTGKIDGSKIKINRYLGKNMSDLDKEFRSFLAGKK